MGGLDSTPLDAITSGRSEEMAPAEEPTQDELQRAAEAEAAAARSEAMVAKIVASGEDAGSYQDLIRTLESSEGFANQEVDREAFVRDTERLRQRMRATRGFLINPRSGLVQYWDMCTGLALLYTATVTPFEVGIGLETKIDALFVVNMVINLIFLIDVGVQFFMPVPDKSGELIRSHAVLAKRYLKSVRLRRVRTPGRSRPRAPRC